MKVQTLSASMPIGEIKQFCRLQDEDQSLMHTAMSHLNLSVRAYHRIHRQAQGKPEMARKIADLAGSYDIQSTLGVVLQHHPKLTMG
ncbi:MAG TPA: hypothetical protein DCY14_18160 [Anaerolineae bacterium]|nr:hypothetical protein [Anaerolineae bacterium]HRJ56516.1 hypothetical protein [Anaerolineales bacterium]